MGANDGQRVKPSKDLLPVGYHSPVAKIASRASWHHVASCSMMLEKAIHALAQE